MLSYTLRFCAPFFLKNTQFKPLCKLVLTVQGKECLQPFRQTKINLGFLCFLRFFSQLVCYFEEKGCVGKNL
jgi:hypothetical protein